MDLEPRTGLWNTARKDDPAFSESRAGNARNVPYDGGHSWGQYTRTQVIWDRDTLLKKPSAVR